MKWDLRFLRLAREVSAWSKDPSTKVGAVLVSPDRHDIFFGYNGFPSRLEDSEERLNNRDLKLEDTIHAEINAILNAKRSVEGFTCYTTFVPCKDCATPLIGAGIARVVSVTSHPQLAERWKENTIKSLDKFERAKVPVKFYEEEFLDYNWNDTFGLD